MSKNDKTLLFAGVLAIGGYFWLKLRAIGNLLFSPGQITGMAFDGAVPVLSLTVIVQNTSNQSLVVNSFAGNVFSNDSLVGNVSSFQPVQVPPNGQAIAVLAIRFRLLGIVNNIIQAYQTNQFRQDLEVVGFANANGLQAPISLRLTVGT